MILFSVTYLHAQYCNVVITASDATTGVTDISFEQINRTSSADEGYVDRTATDTAVVARGGYYRFTLGPIPGPETVRVWFDWNQDGDFDDADEKIFDEELPGSDQIDRDILIPTTAQLGATRLRIRSDDFGFWNSCDTTTLGEAEDFTIMIVDQDMTYRSSDVRQKVCQIGPGATGCFTTVPASNTEVISIEIDMEYLLNPSVAQTFSFDMTGTTTNLANITRANLWYTDVDTFGITILAGTFLNPNGAFSITTSQVLQTGLNYFWLTFDITDDAVSGDIFDAACNTIQIDGITFTPANTSQPSTCRIIDVSETYGPTGNVVPNYSFEEYDCCPPGINTNTLHTPYPWTDPLGTSDHYHSCNNGLSGTVGVPDNQQGNQLAMHGDGYCGIILYHQFQAREYLITPLEQPLEAGRNYCVSLYYSKANKSQYSIDRIGAFFSSFDTDTNLVNVLPYTPQIETTPGVILSDTSNWTQLSGTYTAVGGERYITIGNFYDNANTTFVQDNPGATYNWAYYYFDNVTVVPEPIISFAQRDTSVCLNDSITIGEEIEDVASYLWSTGDTTPFITVSPDDTTTYYLEINNICSSDTDSINVFVRQLPSLITEPLIDTAICLGDSLQIQAISPSASSFIWKSDNSLSNLFINNPIAKPLETTMYYISIIDSSTNCNNADSLSVETITVSVDLGVDTITCERIPLILDAGGDFDSYLWSTNEITSFITVTDSGTYSIYVLKSGCEGSDTVNISISCPSIFVPNVIKLSGTNNLFRIRGERIEDVRVRIFDRWGKMIFEATDINDTWDGMINGKPANQETYVYIVDATLEGIGFFQQRGNLTLIK